MRALIILLTLFTLTSCDEAPPEAEKPLQLRLEQSSFDALPGWEADKLTELAPAFTRSCTRIMKRDGSKPFGALEQSGTYKDWQDICARFAALNRTEESTLRTFFTENFTPHQIVAEEQEAGSEATGAIKQTAKKSVALNGKRQEASQAESLNGKEINAASRSERPYGKEKTTSRPVKPYGNKITTGLFTGYYEAALKGSRTKSGPYKFPLYARPSDLVMVQLGDFRDDLKGRRIAGRVMDGKLKPYENRAQIVNGNWPHNDKVLVWVDNAVDAFFVQIQGSGMVELPDGATMRIGYAGQNGHPYYAIGRELIKRGAVAKDRISMQTIREWLTLNPYEADEIMNTNKSYVFFQELTGEGPIGGEGVALTAERSLAIDRSLLSYGLPIWLALDAEEGNKTTPPWQRLMIAQDTGGAIRGIIRGDIFWGYGDKAEYMAGHMKRTGRYWVLLPKGD